ncbi:Uncharacterised protein [uncultured archaeon]|nr:Uncharacterised protein [uncultured archaeon]
MCDSEHYHNAKVSNTKEFITKAEKVHIKRNCNYSKIKYVNSRTPVTIICPIHGEFSISPVNHLQGRYCPICTKIDTIRKMRSNTDEFVVKAKKIHGKKYDYSCSEYVSAKDYISIRCPDHGVFQQIVSYHLSGNGCPTCNESWGERKIRLYLENHSIDFRTQVKFNDCRNTFSLPFDFGIYYNRKLLGLIEFQGIQHYRVYENWEGEEGLEYRKK